jgi:ketosteroid isomerase-like protein
MEMSRRDLAVAGALALGAAALADPALAEAGDEAAVKKATDDFRQAMISQDKAKLESLLADQLSYGHSSAKLDTKASLIDSTMSRKSKVKSLEFPELKVAMAGPTAIARHLYVSESELDGKSNHVKIGILAIWQKQDGGWKLLARQGFKLPETA